MTHQSLYRRYRPRRFAEVRGQDHVVTALRNAAREGRLGHAYLFSGPRGTGKTSTARILAKVLNCEHPADGEPDLVCESCSAIEAGTSFDLHELDAASHRGIDDVKSLIASTALASPGRTKVYILDEVHMLTAAASAALLKTLEEPPAGLVFVLATTDPQKVLPTIRSRTQHLEFHLLPAKELDDHVRFVIDDAGLDVPPDAIDHVLRVGGGSARDTLSALDQVAAAGGVDERLGGLDALLGALADRDTGGALAAIAGAVSQGRDPRVLAEQLLARLRDVFLAAMRADLTHLSDRDRDEVVAAAERFQRPFITRCLEVLGAALVEMRQAADARITLDVAMARLTDVESDTSLDALVERVARLERALARGGAGPSAAPPSAAPPSVEPAPLSSRPALGAHRGRVEAPSPPDPGPSASATPDLPSRDELTLAWGDEVLGRLPNMARALFQAGRFVDVVGGAARFAVPSAVHREKCGARQGEVEEALAAHFGRAVPLRLVVEGEVPAAAPAVPDGATADGVDPDEVDPDELVDAPSDSRSDLERLVEAFPGAEVIEDPKR